MNTAVTAEQALTLVGSAGGKLSGRLQVTGSRVSCRATPLRATASCNPAPESHLSCPAWALGSAFREAAPNSNGARPDRLECRKGLVWLDAIVSSGQGRKAPWGNCVREAELLKELAAAAGITKKPVRAPEALNEAADYGSAFSRGVRLDLGNIVVLLISGTASIDQQGRTVHVGDFRAQLRRTYANIAALLSSEGAAWKDVVRTTCYLRDIDRDYQAFNEERLAFYQQQELDPFPASTGIQAILCRPELLVEIEAIAVFRKADD